MGKSKFLRISNTTPKLKKTWQIARQAISRSNHLRIIGYSLPVTDNYVSYLLKAAILRSEHLKTIDVMCLDPTGEVKKRYDSFISFRNFQFFNVNTSDYLNSIYETTVRRGQDLDRTVYFDLEKAHKKFVTI